MMTMTIEQFEADLRARGLHIAADRLVAGRRQQSVKFDSPSGSDAVSSDRIIKVHCAKLSCRKSVLMPRSGAHQWYCDAHQVVAVANTEMAERELRRPEKTQVRYKGRVYTAHYIGDDGVAFKLKNGNTVNLDPSRVEWV